MKSWLVWAILSAFLGAALIVLSSMLLKTIPAPAVALFRGVGIFGVSVVILSTAFGRSAIVETIFANIWGLVAVGLVSAASILTFYAALKAAHTEASDEIVTAINYSSLMLIALLNVTLGREVLSLQTLLGISLVFAGLAVLAVR